MPGSEQTLMRRATQGHPVKTTEENELSVSTAAFDKLTYPKNLK